MFQLPLIRIFLRHLWPILGCAPSWTVSTLTGALHSNGMLYEDLWNLASLVAHRNSLLLQLQQPRAHHLYPPRLPLPISTPCLSAVLQRPQCSLVACRRSMLHAVIRSAKRWCSGSRCTSAMFAVSQQKGYGESLSYPSAKQLRVLINISLTNIHI